MQPPLTLSKGAGHLKRRTDFAEKTIRTLCRKRARSGSFFRWGQQDSADTPEGDPSAGRSARPCALLRGFVVLFPRARGSPAPPHKKKKAKAFLFFCGGDNRAPPTPPRGTPRRGIPRDPAPLLRGFVVLFPRARGSPAPPHKKRKAKAFLFLWWGQQGSNL